jgi:hypothetical protein
MLVGQVLRLDVLREHDSRILLLTLVAQDDDRGHKLIPLSGLRVARNQRDPALSMQAGDFIEDHTTGGELALVPPYPLDRDEVGLLESGDDLLAAHRVVARERLILAQPAQLVEDHTAILVGPLVALDLSELDLGVTGKRCDNFLGLEAFVPRDRLIGDDSFHGSLSVRGDPAGTDEGAGIGEAAGMGDAAGIGEAAGIGVFSVAIRTQYHQFMK